jgi:hypothetical protein
LSATVGQVSTHLSDPAGGCSPLTGVQSTVGGQPSYTTPFAGVVTRFSYRANATPGQVRALFFKPSTTPGNWTLLAKTALATASHQNAFPTRISVPAGAVLGIQTTVGGMNCLGPGVAGDTASYSSSFDPDTSTELTPTSNASNYRWNLAVVLENDEDGDGYGDVTQDRCPLSAATTGACPVPNTRIKKAPPKVSDDRSVVVRFKATEKSRFMCRLDEGTWRKCRSPYRKTLSVGRHVLKIRATSKFGIVEKKPAKVTFTIVD